MIKSIIDKRKYGKLIEIESFREQAPIRDDANVVWDLGVHDISILRYLLSSNPIKIKSIIKARPINIISNNQDHSEYKQSRQTKQGLIEYSPLKLMIKSDCKATVLQWPTTFGRAGCFSAGRRQNQNSSIMLNVRKSFGWHTFSLFYYLFCL